MNDREKIIEIIKRNGTYNGRSLSFDYYVIQPDDLADTLIAAGIGDVKAMKEIKYRVRRAEKALYIACRETAEIIFKDDFDRHAQEYMYGYLKQAEKELAEEKKK